MEGGPRVGDAHCHLADLPDPAAAVGEAISAGVGPILAVSMGPDDACRVLEWKRRFPGVVRAGLGLHPSRVPGLTDPGIGVEIATLERRIAGADCVGEIGLDYKDAPSAIQQGRQRRVLDRLLAVAADRRLPMNLHTRRADRELLEAATAFVRGTGLPAVLHWFTHSRKLARRCAEEGLYISVGPSILVDPQQGEVAREIRGDRLLVETDSPVVYGGEAARPVWAARVAAHLALLRDQDPPELQAALAANLGRFLDAGDRGGASVANGSSSSG